ncbi:MAG TPA: hypothetical protein PK264_09755 [Hyphomicrobiaceae bacterium]|nr:hypothetical protein [Hyphomicrobiaceae bacterium]
MNTNEFPYKYPLSAEDLAAIRLKAHAERNAAVVSLTRSIGAALAWPFRLLKSPTKTGHADCEAPAR